MSGINRILINIQRQHITTELSINQSINKSKLVFNMA